MIQLAAFDIDRTLVSQMTYTVAAETAEALRELKRRGVRTAIATGRQWQQVPRMLKELEFDYYILLNGIHITDGAGNTLQRMTIGMENTLSLMDDICGRDRTLYLRFDDGMYPVLERDRLTPFGKPREEIPAEMLEGMLLESSLDKGEAPMAALGQIPKEEETLLRQKYPDLDFLRVMNGPNCDIMPRGVSKGTGLEAVCGILGIGLRETIAFGDDLNDLEMIRMAGTGVAMGDSEPEVLAAADYVTDTCEALGVAKGLRHFSLID